MKGERLTEAEIAYCPTCGHSHHHRLGRLAEGRERCGTTIRMVNSKQWADEVRRRPHQLTPAGQAHLATHTEDTSHG